MKTERYSSPPTGIQKCLRGMLIFTMLLSCCFSLHAQGNIRIKGEIISASDDMPLIGVNVVQKGTSNATVTNIDGQFTLDVPQNSTVVFTYIGHIRQEVVVSSGKTQYNIRMMEDLQMMEEVVVIGYGVQKKKLVTGATVQVKGEDISKMSTISPLAALQSMTPGVNITKTSGQPGEGFKVTIRGIGTTGDSSPLYIVDGVARGGIDYLNPNDIESIDILKDAASTAIYGARAANGVVLITTKQGSTGKATIQYDGYYGIQKVSKKPDMLGAKDIAMILQEGQTNDGLEPLDFASLLAPGDWSRIQSGQWNGTDWLKQMENENAPIQSHSLTVAGGTEQSVYSIGLSFSSQEGIYGKPVQSEYDRYSFRINTEHTLYKNQNMDIIKVGENLTYSYSEKNGIATGNMYYNDFAEIMKTSPFLPFWAKDAQGNDIVGEYHRPIPLLYEQGNPVAKMIYQHGNNLSKNHSLNGNIYAVIQPVKNLIYRTSFGYNFGASSYRSFVPTYNLGSGNLTNTENEVSQSMSTGFGWTFENTLSYTFNINKVHNFNVLAGISAERGGLGESMSGGNKNSLFNDFKHAYLDNANVINLNNTRLGGSPWGKSGLMSYFGRISYDYMEKYMATVVLRADGSSNFAKDKRWGYFPSISLGWVVTNEKFMEPTKDFMDFLKLRASWGQNGNQSISPFQYLATISFYDQDYYFGTSKNDKSLGAYPDLLPNPDVTWETSEQLNFGFDARFLNSRLSLDFDWYNKKTKDWLVQAPVLGSYGAGAPYINGGDVENKGFEMAISWRDKISDFTYGASVNASYNKNKVTRIANAEGIIRSGIKVHVTSESFARAQVGYPIGYFYGFKTNGIFQTAADVQNYKNSKGEVIMPNAVPGDVRFVDLDDNGIIDENDKTQIGKSNPDWNFGLNLNFGYKGFDLLLSGHGVAGGDIFKSYHQADVPRNNYTTEILGRWHGEGTSNKIPRISSVSHINTTYMSDLYIEDASYFRMSNITLGYDFKKILKSLPLSQCRIFITAENLFTITGYSGVDPELGSSGGESWVSGVDLGFYPSPKVFMIGTSIKF